jgi:RNA polymerase sigma factor (sigma-70 family)
MTARARWFGHLMSSMARQSNELAEADEHAASADELLPLARAAAAGDPNAAATLITQVGGSMLTVVRRVLGDGHTDIEDVAQEAAIAFLGTLSKFRGECRVIHFANRIALVTALEKRRRLRSRRRWWDLGGRNLESVPDEALPSPLATMVSTRRRALVRQLLGELPPVIAEALALHFLLGHTVEEIAAMASVSSNTIWSRLRLGKKALWKKLQRDGRMAELLEVSEAGHQNAVSK